MVAAASRPAPATEISLTVKKLQNIMPPTTIIQPCAKLKTPDALLITTMPSATKP